jgi:catechol 2,3-dioxygenase-like lactoylglutathione lyase family enzyme
MIWQFHHTAMRLSDLDHSIHFQRDALGMKLD